MPKKGKKGGGKKKGGKRSHHSGDLLSHIPAEKADVFLNALLAEGKKQSIAVYHQAYVDYKDDVRQLRIRLHKVEHEQFTLMRKLIDSTDEMSFKILDMKKYREEFLKLLDVDHDAKLMAQRAKIDELYKAIENVELVVGEADAKIRDATDYQETHDEAFLEAELINYQEEYAQAEAKRKAYLEKIQTRHEQSLFFTQQRVQRIMQDMEAVACKNQFDCLPDSTLEMMIKNRYLTHQVEDTKKESERLEQHIRRLEEINMDYITKGLELDWNMTYSLSDCEEDYVFDFEHDNDFEMIAESDQEEFNLSDLSDLESLTDDEFLLDFETSVASPKHQDSLMHFSMSNIEETAMKVYERELSKRAKEAKKFGLKGQSIILERMNLIEAGPIKYYNSKVEQ